MGQEEFSHIIDKREKKSLVTVENSLKSNLVKLRMCEFCSLTNSVLDIQPRRTLTHEPREAHTRPLIIP